MGERRRAAAWVALVAAAAFSLALFDCPGTSDVITWKRWTANGEQLGIRDGYAANTADYPPLTTVMLVLTAKAGDLVGVDRFTAFKASLLLFLSLTTLVFCLVTRDLWLGALLHLALTLDAMGLAYLDTWLAPALLLALDALRTGRLLLFTIAYAAVCLTKWPPIILLPFLLVHVISMRHARDLKRLATAHVLTRVVVPGLLILAAGLALFGIELAYSLARGLRNDYLSGNALNANWILTHVLHVMAPQQFGPLQDGVATHVRSRDPSVMLPPRLVFFATYAFALVAYMRAEKTFANLLRYAMVGYLCHITFNTGVHENHLFVAVLLAFLLWHSERTSAAKAVVIALFVNLNLFVFYGVTGTGPPFDRAALGIDVALPLAILWTLYFAVLYVPAIRGHVRAPAPALPITGS
ncbi:MAG TPA: hypothetical protein VF384_08210 [Planctomycetota bacterium]